MREVVRQLEESRIREVANEGLGRGDVLRFWFGESDEVTPDFIREAAIASLNAGETFYAHNLGLPELRHAIAGYTHALHPQWTTDHWFDRIAVTSGGVNGLMLASQALVEAGDEVVVVTPAWPNLVAQPAIMGARLRCVPLRVLADGPRAGAWVLDLPALLAAITPATRLLIVNAPNNPTGWTLTPEEQKALLAHCRHTGTWILADEVYERLYYGHAAEAPARASGGAWGPDPAPGRSQDGSAPSGGSDPRSGGAWGPDPAPGRPQDGSAPSGGSDPRSGGAWGPDPAPGRPQDGSAPSGGSDPRSGGAWGPDPAPGRPQGGSAPSGGSDPRSGGAWGPDPAPGRSQDGSAPLGGSDPRSGGAWGHYHSAPSFLDVAEAHDRLIVAHSFSKSFLMTGWRLGWLVLPASLTHAVGKLIEYNTSCAPLFVQRAATVALQRGDEVTPALVAHLRTCRDTLVPLLRAVPGVTLAEPLGGMYAFFRLQGHTDCLDTAKRLVREAGLGLAPGSAFGPEAAGWLRWCFASRDPQRLVQGVERLRGWLASQPGAPH